MYQKKWYGLILLALLLLVATACSGAPAGPEAQVNASERPPVPVEVAEVGTGNVAATNSYGVKPNIVP